MDITLTLTQQRVEYVLQVLASRPFAEVADTINDIVRQVQARQAPFGVQTEGAQHGQSNGAAEASGVPS